MQVLAPRSTFKALANSRLRNTRALATFRPIMGVTETIQPGDGKSFPKAGQTVKVHYTGTLTNGNKFDSSRDRNDPFKFKLGQGQVIKGWDEGVAQLSKGQRAKLTCTPDYAYGARGFPPVIPANSTLGHFHAVWKILSDHCDGAKIHLKTKS